MIIGDFVPNLSQHWLLICIIGVLLSLIVIPLLCGERGK